MRINRDAYAKLIVEDIAWLRQYPNTLERRHIEDVLRASVGAEYGPGPSGMADPNEDASIDYCAPQSLNERTVEADIAKRGADDISREHWSVFRTPEAVIEAIDEWHAYDCALPVYVWLGMSGEQYGAFIAGRPVPPRKPYAAMGDPPTGRKMQTKPADVKPGQVWEHATTMTVVRVEEGDAWTSFCFPEQGRRWPVVVVRQGETMLVQDTRARVTIYFPGWRLVTDV